MQPGVALLLQILGLDERSSGVALARAIRRVRRRVCVVLASTALTAAPFLTPTQLSDAPPPEGLSRDALALRLQVLADVQDALSSSTRGRGTLSESVTLPASSALGVAALLCDSAQPGDAAAALEAAGRVQTQRQTASDVAIIKARAHLTLAQAALSSAGAPPSAASASASPAARAYEHLRAASQALASAGSPSPAPRLAAEVAQALSDTMPAAARDALAQPPTAETAPARASAVQAVRELMQAGDVSTEYVTGLLRHLTAPEAVALLSWTCEPGGSRSAVAPQLLTAASSAMLATALSGRQPQLAEAILRAPQLQKGPLDRFAPERAIAALMLGEPKTAVDILHTAAGKSRDSSSAAALKAIAGPEFGVTAVKDMDRDTLLAGLCAWAEEWLRSTALSEWQETPVRAGPLLVPYFDTPEVDEYLARRRGTSLRGSIAQQLGAAATAIARLPSQLLAPFASRATAPALPPPAQPLMPMPMTAAQRAAAAVAADKAAKVVAVDTVPATSPRPRYDTHVGLMTPPTGANPPPATPIRMTVPETAAAAAVPSAAADRAGAQASPPPAADGAGSKEPVSYGELMRRKRERGATTATAGAATPTAAARPRRAADASRAASLRQDPAVGSSGLSPQAGAIAAVGVAAALALGCAAMLLRGRLHMLHLPWLPQSAGVAATRVAAQQQQRGVPKSGHPRMTTVREAHRIIRDWQRVKSAAMGAGHEVEGLSRLLGGPLLEEWRTRATKAEKSQFSWRFSLRRVRVTRIVGGTPLGAPAAVEAVLREEGALVDERDGRNVDSYNSTYTVRYLLEDSGDGYRLTRAAVLEAAAKDT